MREATSLITHLHHSILYQLVVSGHTWGDLHVHFNRTVVFPFLFPFNPLIQ